MSSWLAIHIWARTRPAQVIHDSGGNLSHVRGISKGSRRYFTLCEGKGSPRERKYASCYAVLLRLLKSLLWIIIVVSASILADKKCVWDFLRACILVEPRLFIHPLVRIPYVAWYRSILQIAESNRRIFHRTSRKTGRNKIPLFVRAVSQRVVQFHSAGGNILDFIFVFQFLLPPPL